MIVSLLQFVQTSKKTQEEETLAATEPLSSLASCDKVVQECGACSEPRLLETFCHTCSLALCGTCTKAHRKVPSTANHQLISYDEADKQCKERVANETEKLEKLTLKCLETKEVFMNERKELPKNVESIKSKINSMSENAHRIIREKTEELIKKVESFLYIQTHNAIRKVAECEEKCRDMKKLKEVLGQVKVTSDSQANQQAFKSVREFLTSNHTEEEGKLETGLRLAFDSNLAELKSVQLGCLREVISRAQSPACPHRHRVSRHRHCRQTGDGDSPRQRHS